MNNRVYQPLKAIISIAVMYFLLAKLSVQISSVTDVTQLLSLNSGFAFAMMLTMASSRALAGIALGALSLNLFSVSGNSELSLQIFIPVFIVVIQAYIGLNIYRKWVSIDNDLSHDSDLLRFLKVVPLIAIVNTFFTAFIAHWLAPSPQDIIFSVWVKVWVGHAAGLMLIIPAVISIMERNNPLWKARKNIIVINFIASLSITFVVCSNIREFENDRLKDSFNILTNQTTTLLQVSLKEEELLQASVTQLIISNGEITREAFANYVGGLSENNKYIQVVEWLPRIKFEQRAEYEKEQAEYFGEGFSITELKSKGSIIPAAKRDAYYPITYIAPEWDNALAKGFDPSATPAG